MLRVEGFRVHSSRLRQRLARAGATVDEAREVVTLPAELVAEALAAAPGEFDLHDLDGKPVRVREGSLAETVGTYVEAIQWLDYGDETLRPSSLSDLQKGLKLADALPLVKKAGILVTPLDLPLYVEPGIHALGASKRLYVPLAKQLKLEAGGQTTVALAMKLESDEKAYKERVQRQELRRSKGIWAFATLGAGLAVATAAASLYGVGLIQGDNAHDRYMKAKRPEGLTDASRDINEAERMVISAHVLAGLAVATLSVSVYQFITRPAAEAPATAGGAQPVKAPGAGARLNLVPLAGGGLLSLSGSF